MIKVAFHPDAEAELENARTWYRERNQIAGRAFVGEVLSALRSIAEAPEAWPRTRANERRFVFKRFPYSIIYRLRENEVFVTAMLTKGGVQITGAAVADGGRLIQLH